MSTILVGVGLVAVLLLFALVRTAAGGVVTGEVSAWLPHVSRRLVRRVARRLPREQQDRSEEWEAEVAEYADRPLTALMIALRIWWDQRAIVKEAAEAVSAAEMQDVADELDRTLENLDSPRLGLTGTATGFRDLDAITRGLQPGNLIVVAARPSMGKTAFVTSIAENSAIDFDKPIALFSLEMTEAELARRFLASRAGVRGDDLREGRVGEHHWRKIVSTSAALAGAPLFIDDSSDLHLLDIRAKAQRLNSRLVEGLGLVIVDSLELLRIDTSIQRERPVSEIARELKLLARELNVPVIVVSQVDRRVEHRTDKRHCSQTSRSRARSTSSPT